MAALLAGLCKDSALPFVLVLGRLAGRDVTDRLFPCRSVLVPLVMGVVGMAPFNELRFRSPLNQIYLQPLVRTPTSRAPHSG